MQKLVETDLEQLDVSTPIWDRTFMVAPLVIIGTQESNGYDLAPMHMATPMGVDNYFWFVCTPNQSPYHNVKKHKCFTVSFFTPDQIITTSLAVARASFFGPHRHGSICKYFKYLQFFHSRKTSRDEG